jgi:hypothetical protein
VISWSADKNEQLKRERGVSFDEAVDEIEAGRVLALLPHPTRTRQRIYIIRLHGYAHAVPFVVGPDGTIFLKTIYPSRDFQRLYGGRP